MSGMENEIFSKLKNVDSGLKIYPDKKTTYKDIAQYLKKMTFISKNVLIEML